MRENKNIYGILAALTANIFFGFSFIFSKTALSVAEPIVILSVRFTIAFFAMNLLLLTGKFSVNFKNKPKLPIFIMALAQPLFYFILELYGLSKVSSALSGVIISLVPVAATILGVIFLKEKPSSLQMICCLVSIIAVAIISISSNNGSKNYLLGILLLIGAVICSSIFNLLSRSQANIYTPFERTYIMFLIASIGFNIIGIFVKKGAYFPSLISAFEYPDFILSIFYLSVISSVFAFLLYNYATSKIKLVQATSFSNIITVVTILAGVIILKERFTFIEYLLCLIIILGVWGVNIFTKPINKTKL